MKFLFQIFRYSFVASGIVRTELSIFQMVGIAKVRDGAFAEFPHPPFWVRNLKWMQVASFFCVLCHPSMYRRRCLLRMLICVHFLSPFDQGMMVNVGIPFSGRRRGHTWVEFNKKPLFQRKSVIDLFCVVLQKDTGIKILTHI